MLINRVPSYCRVRVANELGAANGQGAKFATIVSTTTSFLISLFASLLVLIFRDKLAMIFSSSQAVIDAVDRISVLLVLTILLNGIQPVLSSTFPKILQHLVAWLEDGEQFFTVFFLAIFFLKIVLTSWMLHFQELLLVQAGKDLLLMWTSEITTSSVFLLVFC